MSGAGKREVLARDKKILHLCRSIVAKQRQAVADRRNSRETIHTIGPSRIETRRVQHKPCRWCGEAVQLVFVDGKYQPQNPSGSHHYCSPRAFVPTRVDCPQCGVPILKCRRGKTGRVALTEIDGDSTHVCGRHLPVRVVVRPPDPKEPSTTAGPASGKPALRPFSEAGENYCPSCGNLLAGSDGDRSCVHCSA